MGKHLFHLHGQDQHGKAVFRKKVNRKQLVEFFAAFHACTALARWGNSAPSLSHQQRIVSYVTTTPRSSNNS